MRDKSKYRRKDKWDKVVDERASATCLHDQTGKWLEWGTPEEFLQDIARKRSLRELLQHEIKRMGGRIYGHFC